MKSNRLVSLIALALAANGCGRGNVESSAKLARQRIVSTPSGIAFVAADRVTAGLGEGIRFGGPRGRSALYLKFPSELRAHGAPRQAFLTLAAREGSAIGDAPLTLEAWRISSDWQPRELQRWFDKPSLAPPYARTRTTSSPPRELRIDVTELVRFAVENPERDFGIAVIASGSDGPAISFDTGFAGGAAPRLELYLP